VSRQVIGVLLFPASALIGALYPTLCRLQATDQAAFVRTEAGALEAVMLFALPVAAGAFLFPDIGVWAFGHTDYGPAEDNVRISSLHLLLVYLSMPLGISLMAAGRQRIWALVQSLCVVVSLALNPFLVPYFQKRFANGGIGLCVAGTVSEVLMVIFGIMLSPKGILTPRLGKTIALAAGCTAAMVGVARAAHRIPSLPLAVLCVTVYAVALWLSGAIAKEHMEAMSAFVTRKFARFRSSS